jgi:hypothetical protein
VTPSRLGGEPPRRGGVTRGVKMLWSHHRGEKLKPMGPSVTAPGTRLDRTLPGDRGKFDED